MSDIAAELAKLHTLKGADYSRQVERIAHWGNFHPVEEETGIFSTGSESEDDYSNLPTLPVRPSRMDTKFIFFPIHVRRNPLFLFLSAKEPIVLMNWKPLLDEIQFPIDLKILSDSVIGF